MVKQIARTQAMKDTVPIAQKNVHFHVFVIYSKIVRKVILLVLLNKVKGRKISSICSDKFVFLQAK